MRVSKMRSTITNNSYSTTESRKDIVNNKLINHSMIICPCRYCLDPYGHIVHCYKNVLFSLWRWKWSHKVNPPKDKKLLPQGWFARAFHLAFRCSMRIDTLDIPCNTWLHPWIELANRSHFVAPSLQSFSAQNVLHVKMSDTSIEYALVPPPERIAE